MRDTIQEKINIIKDKMQTKLEGVTINHILESDDSSFKVSSSGAGGVIFFNSKIDNNDDSDVGLVLKPDPHKLQDITIRMNKAVEQIRKQWKACPINVPCSTLLNFKDNKDELLDKLGNIETDNKETADKLRRQIETLKKKKDSPDAKDTILLMEKLSGSDLNKIDVDRKINLLKSPDFILNFGKTIPLASIIGYHDHCAWNGLQNLSNLFITPGNKVIFMDNSTLTIDENRIGYRHTSINEKAIVIKNLIDNKSVDDLINDATKSLKIDVASNPIEDFVKAVLIDTHVDCLFTNKDEMIQANNELNDNQKKKVYLNFLKGNLLGIQEVLEHQEAIIESLNKDDIRIGDNNTALFEKMGRSFGNFDFEKSIKTIDNAIAKLS